MGRYMISISPDDGSGATTTISVEIDEADGVARIIELTVRAADGSGLLPQQLTNIDLELLTRAVSPAVASGSTRRTTRRSTKKARPAAAEQRAEEAPKSRPTKRQRGRKGAKAAATTLGLRAYRRMPEDLAEIYEQIQSVTGVARHYGVPRHTAQGWMNRLRQGG